MVVDNVFIIMVHEAEMRIPEMLHDRKRTG